MIHYDETNKFYVLLKIGYNLFAFTLQDLITQAKQIYNYNC